MPGDYTIPETLAVAGIGMGIVFAALGLVILLIIFLTKTTADKPALAAADAGASGALAAPAAPPAPAIPANMVAAKGSFGEIKLHDVDDKTAALLMAIVADELKTPLCELRFISIRRKED